MRRLLFLLIIGSFLSSCTGFSEISAWSQIQDDGCVFFIQDPSGTRELWYWCEGEESKPFFEGIEGIQDYSVAGYENAIYFIQMNSDGGADLWISKNRDLSPRRLKECSSSQCNEIAYSSASKVLAFSDFENEPRLKLFDLERGKTHAYPYHATDLEFSPDGKYLGFFDRGSSRLVVLSISGEEILTVDSQEGLTGGWSSDSQKILYGGMTFQDEIPGVNIFSLNVNSGQSEIISDGTTDLMEIYKPKFFQPSELFIAAVRIPSYGFNRQLWVFNQEGVLVTQVTADYTFDHSVFQVNSKQSRIVFQRFSPGTPNSQPEIWIADIDGSNLSLVARNATNPQWASSN
jgi:dipeptidyl aminopeptidase/acylaminoacyl peptidase